MSSWTIIPLPRVGVSLFAAATRALRIEKWLRDNKLNRNNVGVSSRAVKFKYEADATFFQLSFKEDR